MKMPDWYRWYILGEYHCDHCPYSWEERGEEDADAGCLLFKDGELRDTCRYIRNPVSRMIVNGKLNDSDRAFDGWLDYGKNIDICERIYQDIYKDKDNMYCTGKEYMLVRDIKIELYALLIIEAIANRYEIYAHPYKKPWQKLKDAFAEWWKDFTYKHFKRYFRKRG